MTTKQEAANLVAQIEALRTPPKGWALDQVLRAIDSAALVYIAVTFGWSAWMWLPILAPILMVYLRPHILDTIIWIVLQTQPAK